MAKISWKTIETQVAEICGISARTNTVSCKIATSVRVANQKKKLAAIEQTAAKL
jgi:hypothetical protein